LVGPWHNHFVKIVILIIITKKNILSDFFFNKLKRNSCFSYWHQQNMDETDLNIDMETDLNMDIDMDMETDFNMDIDMDMDTDLNMDIDMDMETDLNMDMETDLNREESSFRDLTEEQNRDYEACVLEDVQREIDAQEKRAWEAACLQSWMDDRHRQAERVPPEPDTDTNCLQVAFRFHLFPPVKRVRRFRWSDTVDQLLDFVESQAFLPPYCHCRVSLTSPSLVLTRSNETLQGVLGNIYNKRLFVVELV
jgi:hypothetical protein